MNLLEILCFDVMLGPSGPQAMSMLCLFRTHLEGLVNWHSDWEKTQFQTLLPHLSIG